MLARTAKTRTKSDKVSGGNMESEHMHAKYRNLEIGVPTVANRRSSKTSDMRSASNMLCLFDDSIEK